MKYSTITVIGLIVLISVCMQNSLAFSEESFTPVEEIFSGQDTVKLYACDGYLAGESYEDTINACSDKSSNNYMTLNKNGKGYYVVDNDEKHKARFIWNKSDDVNGVINIIRGEIEISYGFYRNKYANGYGSAISDLPLALEK